jgi:hypothetical protein
LSISCSLSRTTHTEGLSGRNLAPWDPGNRADRLAESFDRSNDELQQIREEFRPMMHAAQGVEDEMEEMRETVQRVPGLRRKRGG